ncbi:MAG: hypothetical protein BGO65_09265 [Afipia sp. 64-13]|nr:MAG: hypothetical protein BGO65_09265 [Afipia sp. 64-13]
MLAATAAGVFGAAWAAPAAAQGRLDAKYAVTLAGLPIGKGSWTIAIGNDDFSAAVSGGTTGLLQALGKGGGTGSSQGRIVGGALVPAAYVTSIMYGKKNETIRINLAGGNVKDWSIEPEPPVDPRRVPVTDAHRRGVWDPMTASLLRVPGNGDPVSPEVCTNRTTAIFDGRMRYELQLEYRRMESVKHIKGYQGPAVVCAVYFKPISGYVPDRYAIKYLATLRDMEVTLAPIAGTRVLVPLRIKIPTPIGTGLVQATEFITAPTPRTAAKTN